VRIVLVLVLVHGLVPDLAELGEAAVHYARTGHVAHTAADRGDLGEQDDEHGCGTTQHRCTCCASQALAAPAGAAVVAVAAEPEPTAAAAAFEPPSRDPRRPFRPPIS
jgi:hypothetical protein